MQEGGRGKGRVRYLGHRPQVEVDGREKSLKARGGGRVTGGVDLPCRGGWLGRPGEGQNVVGE